MGFKATEAVEALDYDFTPYITGKAATGTIPEPSSDKIDTFRQVLRSIIPTKTVEGGKVVIDLAALNEKFEAEKDRPDEVLLAAIEAFTSRDITVATLTKLSQKAPRHFQAFVGWLTGEFFDTPEALRLATNS